MSESESDIKKALKHLLACHTTHHASQATKERKGIAEVRNPKRLKKQLDPHGPQRPSTGRHRRYPRSSRKETERAKPAGTA
jgi:hypothetical protein